VYLIINNADENKNYNKIENFSLHGKRMFVLLGCYKAYIGSYLQTSRYLGKLPLHAA